MCGTSLTTNADMGSTQVRDHCPVDETGRHTEGAGRGHAAAASRAMNLSARAYHRVLKLARTIADLAGSERIQPAHLAEAIHLRSAETDRLAQKLKTRPADGRQYRQESRCDPRYAACTELLRG